MSQTQSTVIVGTGQPTIVSDSEANRVLAKLEGEGRELAGLMMRYHPLVGVRQIAEVLRTLGATQSHYDAAWNALRSLTDDIG